MGEDGGRAGRPHIVRRVFIRLAVHCASDGRGGGNYGVRHPSPALTSSTTPPPEPPDGRGERTSPSLSPSVTSPTPSSPSLLSHLVHEAVESLGGVSAAAKAVLGGRRGGGEEGGSVQPPKQSWVRRGGEGRVGSVQPPKQAALRGRERLPPSAPFPHRPCSPPGIGGTPMSSCSHLPPHPSHLLPSQHQRPSRLQRLSALTVRLGHCAGGGGECEQGLGAWIRI